MELEYRASFNRDLKRLRDAALHRRVSQTIEALEAASTISDVPGIRRIRPLSGNHYRIRIGSYRLGIALEGDVAILVRFLHRREIYRSFP